MLEVLHRSPRLCEVAQTRWTLRAIQRAVPGMQGYTSLSGVWRALQRVRVHYKRGRRYLHSPDPEYATKLGWVQRALALARARPARYVVLFQDEITYYRRPTVAASFADAGRRRPDGTGGTDPLAKQGLGRQLGQRIAGAIDALHGTHHAWQRTHFGATVFLAYLRALQAAYPQARRLFVVLDNWPVHHAAEVRAGLRGSRITLLYLPTYAPWTNPEEQVWRKLYAEVLHLHEFAERWTEFKDVVQGWLDAQATTPGDLLRYVGLSCPP